MEIQFYTISEDMARAANDANSMSDYKQGSATEEYRKRVESVYAVVEKIKQKRPNLAEKAERMAGRYSKKLAEYYNSYYRNEASCPSVLISGAGNFPVKKKNKQNSRRDSLMQEWNSLESYAKKITNLLTMNQPILSGDAQAIEMLEEKAGKPYRASGQNESGQCILEKAQNSRGMPGTFRFTAGRIEKGYVRKLAFERCTIRRVSAFKQ